MSQREYKTYQLLLTRPPLSIKAFLSLWKVEFLFTTAIIRLCTYCSGQRVHVSFLPLLIMWQDTSTGVVPSSLLGIWSAFPRSVTAFDILWHSTPPALTSHEALWKWWSIKMKIHFFLCHCSEFKNLNSEKKWPKTHFWNIEFEISVQRCIQDIPVCCHIIYGNHKTFPPSHHVVLFGTGITYTKVTLKKNREKKEIILTLWHGYKK